MEQYDYRESVKNDVINYIKENYTEDEIEELKSDRQQIDEELYNTLWMEDSVTGNASGSYWFSTWKAEEALAHNWELIEEMLNEYGYDANWAFEKGAENVDVAIRCYLLYSAIDEAMEEL